MRRKPSKRSTRMKKRLESLRRFAVHTFLFLVAAVIVVMLGVFTAHSFGMAQVVLDDSMQPTLASEEVVLLNRLGYRLGSPDRLDIIAMRIGSADNSPVYIRRVVGVPGDTIRITGGVLYVNDEPLQIYEGADEIRSAGQAESAVTLDNDSYFVLCDNYNNSSDDSRRSSIGTVDRSQIIGKAWFITAPLKRMGKL